MVFTYLVCTGWDVISNAMDNLLLHHIEIMLEATEPGVIYPKFLLSHFIEMYSSTEN